MELHIWSYGRAEFTWQNCRTIDAIYYIFAEYDDISRHFSALPILHADLQAMFIRDNLISR